MTALIVLSCGPGASVQDRGRLGHRRMGVSTAGAADLNALALANALVGNPTETAAIELPVAGARFRVEGDSLLLAVAGPGVTFSIAGRRVPDRTSAMAHRGETIAVGAPREGVYAYLAAGGGFLTEPVLGSRAVHMRTGVGGSALRSGDRLPCRPTHSAPLHQVALMRTETGPIRVLRGPQFNHFDAAIWERLLSSSYTVSVRSDRMGMRLRGPELAAKLGHDILSDGVVPGSIQVPGSGQPIILGQDCQTTGGYPKIATVISADLPRLFQTLPGHPVQFAETTLSVAHAAAKAHAAWRNDLPSQMRPVAASNLLSHNLIGGVTDGGDE